MAICFVTDVREGESDILSGNENKTLSVVNLDGGLITEIVPINGPWTHEKLCSIADKLDSLGLTQEGADAFLGEQWVGSTEI